MSRHDKDYNSSIKLSTYADIMLDRIDTCINDKITKNVTRLASAIVTKVNADGSVNVRLPSEDKAEFTKIQNQCPYELKVGDAVELTLKNGSFNNCWISARHGMGVRATSDGSSGSYVLPVATATQLGGIKVGAGLVISNGILSVTGGGTADAVEWKNVLSTPTTLAGYGITDARINSGTITLGGNSIVPLTASSELDATKLVGNVPSATKATQDGAGNVIADTYAKKDSIPSLTGYATQTWVENKGYLTEHQSLTGYALKTDIPTIPTKVSAFENDKGYLTSHQSLADYATQSWVQAQGYLTSHQSLTGYATEEWVTQQGYLTKHQSLEGYALETWVQNQGYLTEHQSLARYATQQWVKDQKYLTSHQSLEGYATEEWVQQKGYLTTHQDISNLATKTELQTVENKIPTVPTKVSVFENDKGYLTEHQSLENYALKTEIPKNVSDLTNDAEYITESEAPVQSVNGKTGVVSLTATDVGALPNTTEIPVVNNAKLTIQKNGESIDSFTANASVDKTINITVPTKASDINAISTDNISQTLGSSETKVPSEKAVSQAMSAAGYGDMLKANYAQASDNIVDKAFADENGKNIASTYIPKFTLLNNIDANTLTTSQIGVVGAGNTNLPDNATGSVLFVAGDGANAFQIIVVYATNVLSHRAYKDGTWTIWRSTEASISADSATNFDAYGIGFITGE